MSNQISEQQELIQAANRVEKGNNINGRFIMICCVSESDFVEYFQHSQRCGTVLFRAINRQARATADKTLIQYNCIPSITALPSNLRTSYYLWLRYFHSKFHKKTYTHKGFHHKCVRRLDFAVADGIAKEVFYRQLGLNADTESLSP